jgi:hypothetical protein
MAKQKRPSWIIRALKAAFADKPSKDRKVSRPRVTKPDNVSSATANQVARDRALKKRGGSGRA